jgi:hypothetical protein
MAIKVLALTPRSVALVAAALRTPAACWRPRVSSSFDRADGDSPGVKPVERTIAKHLVATGSNNLQIHALEDLPVGMLRTRIKLLGEMRR